ncbi:MAG: hypothetical protein KI793_05540 [Rivularia sp. (in: Bacteria)]|nr:hypothetical protein [Rivularia sp. MS3]
MQTVINPVAVTISSKNNNNDNQVNPGDITSNRIEIKNNNNSDIQIDIWLVTIDEKSQPLLHWCEFEKKDEINKRLQLPLVIKAKEKCDIDLNFRVPPQAQPGLYKYDILIKEEDNSSKPPIRRPQQLRVLRSDITAQSKAKPEFYLEPSSNSEEPLLLKAGESKEIKIKVENKSRRVDTFYLTCPDLDEEWFTVSYPESPFIRPGLVRETDGLDLNPRQSGECTLILHPPKYIPAGNYFPTVQLISQNNENLVLLDVVYLKILPNASLIVDITPHVQQISGKRKCFKLEVSNQGNFDREVKFTVDKRDDIFNYTFVSDSIQLSPAEETELVLKVKPKRWKWWLRCFKARQEEINFDLKLEDDKFLAPEEVLSQGTLIWVSRPWWLFWFLIAWGFLSLGAIGIFIWSVFLNRPLPPYPEITELKINNNSQGENNNSYKEGDTVTFDWNVNYLDKVKRITFITLNKNNEINRTNYTINKIDLNSTDNKNKLNGRNFFDFNLVFNRKRKQYAIDSELLRLDNLEQQPCQILKVEDNKILKCTGFPVTLARSGKNVLKIELFTGENSKEPIDVKKTDTITVLPHPIPIISSLSTDKPNYKATKNLEKPQVTLQWDVINLGNVKEFNLTALKPDNSLHFQETYVPISDKNPNNIFIVKPKAQETKKDDFKPESRRTIKCEKKDKVKNQQPKSQQNRIKNFNCNLTFSKGLQPDDYIFQLSVVPTKQGKDSKLAVQKTPVIKVAPIPPTSPLPPIPNPQIINFSTSATSYQEVISNTQDSKTQSKSSSKKTVPPPIRLNWNIANHQKIKQIKIVALDSQGSLYWQKPYSVEDLKKLASCDVEANKNISCTGVPTDINKAGSYKFDLVVTYKDKETYSEIIKSTPNIKIQPPPKKTPKPSVPPTPVKIAYFKVNGEDASQNPKRIIEVHKEIQPPDIILSWKVEEGEDIEVELLPSPGLVPTKQNSLSIPISQSPGSETITLKAKNKQTGEEKIQSVVIQTVDITPPKQVQPLPNPQSQQGLPDISNPGVSGNNSEDNSGNNNPTQQQPSNPDELPPMELPPQLDSTSRD